ncbi:MAG: ABC transporter substrate-binding protein [Candidatus Omnitrophota bacterium]
MNKRTLFILLTILLLVMLLVGIKKRSHVLTSSNLYGGTLVWGAVNKPTIINPILTTQSISMGVINLIFNGLVRINSKGEIEPDLAQSWDISQDGLVYTFHLREGIKFHDGRECTAYDVKFTYDKIVDPDINSPFKSFYQLVREFKAVDKLTFQAALRKPLFSFIYRFTREIVPKHILENKDLSRCAFNYHPIGTGPFKFKEWKQDGRIVLDYNPDYYEGRPYLDRVIAKTYTDSRNLWAALMRGEVDFVLYIGRQDYEIVRDDPAFKAYNYFFDFYYTLIYNLNDPVLADKRVRYALAYGIDRKELIEKVAFGYGLECNGPFYPDSLGFNPDVEPFKYSPQRSRQLLAQAGWEDTDGDGILGKEAKELELSILVDERNDIYKNIIMVLRQQLQRIGVKTQVQLYNDDSELTDKFLAQNKPQAHLKMLMAGMDPDQQAPHDWCSEMPRGLGKLWIYRNDEVNRLFMTGKVSRDKEQRDLIYRRIHRLIYEDQPACFLYFPFIFHAVSNKFENTDDFFTVNMPFYTIKDWRLKSN